MKKNRFIEFYSIFLSFFIVFRIFIVIFFLANIYKKHIYEGIYFFIYFLTMHRSDQSLYFNNRFEHYFINHFFLF